VVYDFIVETCTSAVAALHRTTYPAAQAISVHAAPPAVGELTEGLGVTAPFPAKGFPPGL